ncbi:MAG TPA: prepilin-type N-terminal cleavage/methylation domain-containing protein [Gammaproteobacteria bacterium]|nr:prepilin-type N-terminal cleavage/methylation domain-containing protein [Gammaproteobacteria bacterium]
MRKQHGFTLVELMMTLVIGALLLTMAVPSFRGLIQNNKIASQANELVSALSMARMEAIRQSSPVSICASADQTTCSGTNDWSTGWIVFEDTNSSGAPAVSRVLRAWGPLSGDPNLSENGGAAWLRYQRDGTTGTRLTFTHTIPDCTGNQQRIIDISAAGRVSTTRSLCP